MKPLTAEDLVIGGKYKIYKSEVEYLGRLPEGYAFRGNSGYITYADNLLNITPYTEPNQTTMNTDYTEQPFNLETALKHPEWVYFRNGEKPLEWHWFKTAQWQIVSISPKREIQVNYENGAYHYDDEIDAYFNPNSPYDLILRVPFVEKWANLYDNFAYLLYNTKEEADCYHTKGRIACVPVKIPANE